MGIRLTAAFSLLLFTPAIAVAQGQERGFDASSLNEQAHDREGRCALFVILPEAHTGHGLYLDASVACVTTANIAEVTTSSNRLALRQTAIAQQAGEEEFFVLLRFFREGREIFHLPLTETALAALNWGLDLRHSIQVEVCLFTWSGRLLARKTLGQRDQTEHRPPDRR